MTNRVVVSGQERRKDTHPNTISSASEKYGRARVIRTASLPSATCEIVQLTLAACSHSRTVAKRMILTWVDLRLHLHLLAAA
jgi:hypothetical protein